MRCVNVEEQEEKIMNEVHPEICGSHMHGYSLDIKVTPSRVLLAYDGIAFDL